MTQTGASSGHGGGSRKTRAAKRMKEIMTEYYLEAMSAGDSGKTVAWITSGGPVEPLLAMDVIPIYPENHSAMIGASKIGADFCAQAEALGFPRDLCSYARADIACSRSGGGPIGGLPRPDMLICCTNICSTVLKWYEVQARFFQAPLFILDTPLCHGELTREAEAYARRQIDEYIAFLEGVLGRPFDFERLEEVGRLSIQAQRLWREALQTAGHSPAPLSAFDAFFHLALIVTLRGTQVCVDYYGQLLSELQERVDQGIGAVSQEKYRLVWDNLPVWPRTRWLSETFASRRACLVADTYTAAWCSTLDLLDESDFLSSMAGAYSRIHLNLGLDRMAETIIQLLDFYRADGLVMHSNRSCKPYSFGQYDIQRLVQDRTGLPVVILEADMVDDRAFAESQVETRIEAFMEMLEQR
jgi:benzoyl-CoA reductase/2-hydroxyglutaryl-CoA dehydratase subunit BcrC/BadD/HgdB